MRLNFCVICLALLKVISSKNIIPVEEEPKQDVVNIINELNHYLSIEWNLVFIPEQHDVDIVLKSLIVPAIILTKNSKMQLHLLHSDNFMSVVFLDKPNSRKSHEIVNEQLQSLKFRPILWIVMEVKEEELLSFAQMNWFSGFTRALFFTQQGLFTYNPVPAISIQRVSSIQDYTQKRQIVDFKKYPLNLAVKSNAPYCFFFHDHTGKIVYTGYYYKVLQIFIKYYNFQENHFGTLNAGDPSEIKTLNERFKNNTMDIIPTSLYEFNSEYIMKSKVVSNEKWYILVPYPEPLSKMSYLHYPFTFSTKITIVLLLFLYAASLTFIYYRSKGQRKIDFSGSLLHVLASLMFQSHCKFKVETTRQKIVLSLLFVNGFVITNLYLAKLSSIMVKNVYESKIEKLDDLNKTSLNIIMQQAAYELLGKYPHININVLKKAEIVEKAYLDNAYRDMNNTYLLIVSCNAMSFFFFQQQFMKTPRMYYVKEDVAVLTNYFTLRKNLPYRQLFNRYLTYIRESGIFDKISTDTYYDGITSGTLRFFTDEGEDLFLTWESFYAISAYFALGIVLSAVVFVLELVHHKYAKE